MFIGENEKDFNVTRNNAYNYNINLNLADASDKRITIEKIPLEGIAAEANLPHTRIQIQNMSYWFL